ncbi:MAG: translocation/assembly module TamB domain-containing protein [Hymenobacteraceae bacterium]|nr:translocation/assembly module TamB domain-containing protein [Hymenobacteraceae bacterium]
MAEASEASTSPAQPAVTPPRRGWPRWVKWLIGVPLTLVLLALLLVGGVLVALRFPSVQTWAARKAATTLTQKLGHEVTIGRVDVRPFSRVLLDRVRVLDYKKQELFNIGRLDANISLFSIFHPDKLHISTLRLVEPRFRMVTYAGTDSTNLDTFLASVKRLMGPPSDTTASTFDFKIEAVALENGRFILDDENTPRQKEPGFDYAHMRLDSIYGDLTALNLGADSIGAQVTKLRTVDRAGNANLRNLTAAVTWSDQRWSFRQTDLQFNDSHVQAPLIRFDYPSMGAFGYFIDSVRMTLRLDSSRVHGRDVAVFAPVLNELFERDVVTLSGQFDGKVNNFRTRNLLLALNHTTRLRGSFAMDGLPGWQETLFDLNFQPSVVDPRDIKRFLPADAYTYVERLGTTRLRGQFTGYYNDFVANGTFATRLGTLTSDINLKIKSDARRSTYSGTVRTDNFQLGRLIGQNDLVQTVSLNGRVKGQSFDLKTIRLETDVRVRRIALLGYTYQSLTARGTLLGQSFSGHVSADDPNLKLTADGDVTFDPKRPEFDLKADFRHVDLRALGYSKVPFTLATRADVDFQGLTLDALVGRMKFRDTRFRYDTARGRLDSLDIVSTLAAGQRTLAVHSEALDVRLVGDFRYSDLIRDVGTLAREYVLEFEANPAATAAYYRRKAQRPLPDYRVELAVQLTHVDPLLRVFVPGLEVADSTKLDGFFRTGKTSIFQLGGNVAHVRYGKDVELVNNAIEFNTSKLPYSDEVLANAFVTSRQQRLPTLGLTENLRLEALWNNGLIDFTSAIKQQKSTNAAQLNGSLAFLTNAIEVRLTPESGINLLATPWRFQADNRVVIGGAGQEITVENLFLRNGAQTVGATGRLSESDRAAPLAVTIDSFQLASLNPLFGTGPDALKLGGLIRDTHFDISQAFAPQPTFGGELRVDSLTLDSVLLGDVAGNLRSAGAGRLGLDLNLARGGQRLLTVDGGIAPNAEPGQQLSLQAALTDAPLKLVEPFLDFLMDDLRGTMSGELAILGPMAAPILRGGVDIHEGRMRFGYLNTRYRLSGPLAPGDTSLTNARVQFDKEGIRLRSLVLRDEFANNATLDGTIYEQGFQNMSLDLRASFRRFMVLNTTRKQNNLYYGTAFSSGRLAVTGTPEDLAIRIDAKTDPGTRLSIPLDNQAEVSRSSFIKFVSYAPSGDTLTTSRPDSLIATGPDLSGLRLDMNLDVTPDAQLEVIFDESTGDIIRGTGQGRVALAIDTRGNFNMYGNVEIVRGLYNFTLLGVVNKEFIVRPGGTISWNGDPYGGTLNLTATYTQKTSLQPILSALADIASNTNVVVPVVALMNLKGSLLAPEILLGLDFTLASQSSGTLSSALDAYANNIRNDPQELNRQVFSLLVLKRLSAQNEFNVGANVGNNAFSNSIGELLSTQLSYWISQIDSNLEIDLGLAGFDQTALQALQVRVSYSFMQGRLRLTREGGVSNANSGTGTSPIEGGTGTSSSTGANQALGDISLEYYIRPDGHLRLKLAYETTSRDIQRANTARQAGSLVHTQQFDSFAELFRPRHLRKRKLRQLKDLEEKNGQQSDDGPQTHL